jgi:hypothetical protein
MTVSEYESLFKEAAKISSATLLSLKGELVNENILLVLLLERTNNIFLTISTLIPSYVTDKRHEYGMGLILRTGLLDLLVTLNLRDIFVNSQNLENDLEEFAFDILGDGFKYILDLAKTEHALKFISDEEYEDFKRNTVFQYPSFFEPYDGENLKVLKSLLKTKRARPKELYSTFKSNQPEDYFSAQAYGMYSLYSKYEHINLLYHNISRNVSLDERLTLCFDYMLIQARILHETLLIKKGDCEVIRRNLDRMIEIVDDLNLPQ